MKNLTDLSDYLIENGFSLSKLNQHINKGYYDIVPKPFLLSIDEVKKMQKLIQEKSLPDILSVGEEWWLQSPGHYVNYATLVNFAGDIYSVGIPVYTNYGVRPAFHIEFFEDSNFKLGNKIKVADIPYTVVLIEDSKATILCDSILFKSAFNEDVDKGNNYETSDIKRNLENYFKDKELKVEFINSQSLDEMLEKSGLNPTPDFSEEISNDR